MNKVVYFSWIVCVGIGINGQVTHAKKIRHSYEFEQAEVVNPDYAAQEIELLKTYSDDIFAIMEREAREAAMDNVCLVGTKADDNADVANLKRTARTFSVAFTTAINHLKKGKLTGSLYYELVKKMVDAAEIVTGMGQLFASTQKTTRAALKSFMSGKEILRRAKFFLKPLCLLKEKLSEEAWAKIEALLNRIMGMDQILATLCNSVAPDQDGSSVGTDGSSVPSSDGSGTDTNTTIAIDLNDTSAAFPFNASAADSGTVTDANSTVATGQ